MPAGDFYYGRKGDEEKMKGLFYPIGRLWFTGRKAGFPQNLQGL